MSTTPQLNDADLRYLTETLEALGAAAELSDVAAVWGTDVDVRALARWTLAAQRVLITAVTTCLDEHDATTGASARGAHPRPATRHLRSLDGAALDRSFVASLSAHLDRSLLSARAEMVEGQGGEARGIAEQSIRSHSHEIEVVKRLAPRGSAAAVTRPT